MKPIGLCVFHTEFIWDWYSLESEGTNGYTGHLGNGRGPKYAHHGFATDSCG